MARALHVRLTRLTSTIGNGIQTRARQTASISRLTCYLCEESGDKFGGVGESLARYAAKVASALAALEA